MPALEALGTAVPGPAVPQSAVKDKAASVLAEIAPDLLPHLKVFDSTGIQTRHFVRGLDWFLEAHGWAERSDVYRTEGLQLLETAARQALDAARVPASSVDAIVLVSTTGIATPSLDARLLNRLPFPNHTTRVPVWGLGCAGGVAGLTLATSLARAHPDQRVLLLSLELCSLAFQLNRFDLKAFVASTLFADGAAAALIRGDELPGPARARMLRGASHEWPNTEDVMGWDVLDEGLSVVFSKQIPTLVERDLAPFVRDFLNGQDSRLRYAFHPGGTKVLQAYEAALGLGATDLESARHVLRTYGNMSSPSVLFALDHELRHPLEPGQQILLAALGPGFAGELHLLEAPPA